MIRRITLVAALAVCVASCAEVEKKHLTDLEAKIDAKIAESASQLEQKIYATDAKYAKMLALEQKVTNGVRAIDANAQLLQKSGDAMRQILQTYRNLLREQLKSVEDQLATLSSEK